MSQQGLRQASVRAVSGTTLTYEGDFHAMWDGQSIATGTFNERMLRYVNLKLGTIYVEINGAMQALAASVGATNFGSIGTFTASTSSYESEASTLFAAMSPEPDSTRKGHINTLIAALKAGGVWAKLDVLYILAAHAAQPARLNWKAPASFAATAVNSPTFTIDRGYQCDSVASYLNPGWTPSTNGVNYTQNSAHMGVWSRTSIGSTHGDIGFDAVNGHIFAHYTDDQTYARINGPHPGVANTNGTGLIIGDRPDSGNIVVYRNGVSLGSQASTSTAVPAGSLLIGSFPTNFSEREFAAATAGGKLTAGEHTAYYNAMQAYMTAVGA